VLEAYAGERQVRLELNPIGTGVARGSFLLRCDGQAIQQALVNLIDNAVKHSPPGTVVTVGLDSADHTHHLWVEDHGSGIPPEDCEKIFEPFYRRGSELRRESAGIGIGLTLVKHIAEAHLGRVQVRSEVGKGSRFTMVLPNRPPAGMPPGSGRGEVE
jgi:signal transduction histidine kinase